MQRAKCISSIYVSILILVFGISTMLGQDPAKLAKAELVARKAEAHKAADKARATAKTVQKAQETSAAKRINADKLQEVATADKAKLAAGLGRKASPKELEKLTQRAQKSADAARPAQEEAEKAVG